MIKNRFNLFIIIIFFLENIYAQNNFDTLLNRFLQIPEIPDSTIYKDIKSTGIKIIPYLIELIDTNKQILDFCNTYSNKLYLNYFGIYAAKLIEEIANCNDENFKFYKIYNKKENTYILNYDDMIKIKKLYKKWWRKINLKNNSKFLKKGALNGSDYCWRYCYI